MTAIVWWDAARAFLMALGLYAFVVLAFRAGKRRTVAELAPFDLAAVIAVGAIVGRTATGGNPLAVGITAVAGLPVGHAVVSRLRHLRSFRALVDHPTSVLVVDGRIRPVELRRSGLTRGDLEAALRSHGVQDIGDVAVAVFETRNGVSILTKHGPAPLWQHLSDEESATASSD
ncbi:YetF domain-containing protein [Terrabacter sp. NPDC080008]|uniref:DUF421 domain-containing protein n=1 Tax=Terrabacter sp. NPDC080008 TaxID=3155176 RepID=UPI00344DF785